MTHEQIICFFMNGDFRRTHKIYLNMPSVQEFGFICDVATQWDKKLNFKEKIGCGLKPQPIKRSVYSAVAASSEADCGRNASSSAI
ncbi:hypothetical protein BZL35_00743 [Candidatus Pandoraea novymonadis]|uniref:Uncharacterized protein n=1 Tax=Candidatus Pandoraea novymonadis TaxID=1808959 RepID=A0ABX5FD40_9BURK|nr:hypothetical protein BZL35_00743 [Candidatus Pandoraea novymonadis]